ncbi:hypothetical protein CBS76997_2472 [Aspergillus niger]|nr:hypothetical protein CBS76997_2472 [Aspergillus niger]
MRDEGSGALVEAKTMLNPGQARLRWAGLNLSADHLPRFLPTRIHGTCLTAHHHHPHHHYQRSLSADFPPRSYLLQFPLLIIVHSVESNGGVMVERLSCMRMLQKQ